MRRTIMMLMFVLLVGSMLHAIGTSRGIEALFGLSISPNPFEFETTITVAVQHTTYTNLVIYDSNNQIVKHIYGGLLSDGYHQFSWCGKDDAGNDLPTGRYTCEVSNQAKFTSVKKFIILK